MLAAFLAVLAVSSGILFFGGSRYAVYASFPSGVQCESAEVSFGGSGRETSDLIEVKSVKIYDRYAKAVVRANRKGTEHIALKVQTADGKSSYVAQEVLKSGINNIIYNNIHQNLYIALAAFSLIMCVYYFVLFLNSIKHEKYSYNCIFFMSVSLIFLLMVAVWCGAIFYSVLNYHMTSSVGLYTIIENLTLFVTIITLPLTFLFAVSVSVSNIQLMRKEGFTPRNALGIAVSIAMMAGLAVVGFLVFLNGNTSSPVVTVLYSVISALYVVFEAVLICTVFCGIYVSKSEPEYDRDYIIILGCAIKKDGTLYPLIRGRVDRAIEFYRAQLEKTGRKAVFVPSGGQGSDEIIPEAQAMKNYLIEQGIPEEQILPEAKSATTFENMKFSKALIDSREDNAKTVFSTTSYHVFRSGIIASSAGLDAQGIGSKTKWYFWPNAFLREVAGLFVSQPKKQIIILLVIAVAAGAGSYAYAFI